MASPPKKPSRNHIDALIENDMLNFVYASLISADTLTDEESCRKSLELLHSLKADLEASSLEDKDAWASRFDDAERIIKSDMRDFATTRK